MGLAERRALQAFQENDYVVLKKKIDDAVGFAVLLEVDWEAIAAAGQSEKYAVIFPKIYFEPLAEAFNMVCSQDAWKTQLKQQLKKVAITGKSKETLSFVDSVLTLDRKFESFSYTTKPANVTHFAISISDVLFRAFVGKVKVQEAVKSYDEFKKQQNATPKISASDSDIEQAAKKEFASKISVTREVFERWLSSRHTNPWWGR